MDKSSSFSKLGKLKDDYDRFREDKGYRDDVNDTSSNLQADPQEQEFYASSRNRYYGQGSSSGSTQQPQTWSDEFRQQQHSWVDEFGRVSTISWADEFDQGYQSRADEFNQNKWLQKDELSLQPGASKLKQNQQLQTNKLKQNQQSRPNQFRQNQQLRSDDFNQNQWVQTNNFNQDKRELFKAKHDQTFEDEILDGRSKDIEDYMRYDEDKPEWYLETIMPYKFVDWDGYMVYKMPKDYNLNNLEYYADYKWDDVNHLVHKRFKMGELVNNYKHIRNRLFGNNLPLNEQNVNDLYSVYVNGVLDGVWIEKSIKHFDEHDAKLYFIKKMKEYINGLTLLVTLDNTNKRMINRLSDFDLRLLVGLNIEESSELGKIDGVHSKLDKILSYRYKYHNKKYDDIVDKHVSKSNKNDFMSDFYIRNVSSNHDMEDKDRASFETTEVKYIIDPFTGDKYVSFLNEYTTHGGPKERMYDLIPYRENLNFNNVIGGGFEDTNRIMERSKSKDFSDMLNQEEYSRFIHMDNMRRLEKLKDSLGNEDVATINTYDNNTEPLHNDDSYYKINYKPLVYIALKYNPDFLKTHHNNIETDAITVIENHMKKIQGKKSPTSYSNELNMSIKNKDIDGAIKTATYMYKNNIPYARNTKLTSDLLEYVKNIRNNKIKESYTELINIVSKLGTVTSRL